MTLLQLQKSLVDAQAAYHSLQTGTLARVVVDSNGERVEFVAANSAKLYAYIQTLQAQLPQPLPMTHGGPATFTF